MYLVEVILGGNIIDVLFDNLSKVGFYIASSCNQGSTPPAEPFQLCLVEALLAPFRFTWYQLSRPSTSPTAAITGPCILDFETKRGSPVPPRFPSFSFKNVVFRQSVGRS